MIPFDLFGQAWVLFRDQDGKPACILDECAHRACPLSVGRVVDGQAECPYVSRATVCSQCVIWVANWLLVLLSS